MINDDKIVSLKNQGTLGFDLLSLQWKKWS